jgi:hypothetical protein
MLGIGREELGDFITVAARGAETEEPSKMFTYRRIRKVAPLSVQIPELSRYGRT